MDQGRAEMGLPHRSGFRPVNPFTSSIAQVTYNRQHPSGIENVDHVCLPPHPRSHFPRVRWQTPHLGPQLVHDSYAASTPIKPTAHYRERSRSPVAAIPVMPHTEAARVSDGHLPSDLIQDAQRRPDFSTHPSIWLPLERERSESSYTPSLHDSVDYPASASTLDYVATPACTPISISSSHSSTNAGRLLSNRVPLLESLPQRSSDRSRHTVPQPAHTPSLSQATPLVPYHNSYIEQVVPADPMTAYIPSPWIPEYERYEVSPATGAAATVKTTIRSSIVFATDILPRQLYLHFLLRLPSFYFSRVSGIFTEADLTLEQIHEMALQVYTENKSLYNHNMLETERYGHSGITILCPAYERLKWSWEHFIDNLIREWKTLNIVSVLLLSAIMTTFQIHGAAEDPVTRYLAFWSLICALMSLLYSCSSIIQFASMRKAHKAVGCAIEAQKMQTILWNVWVMLAMPMVWMTWSIMTFIASMMSFLWRARANLPSNFEFSVGGSTELGFRVFICAVLGLGVVYGALILSTFRRYGSEMDEKWTRRMRSFIENADPKPICRSVSLSAVSQNGVNCPTTIVSPVRPTIAVRTRSNDGVSPTVSSSLSYQSQPCLHHDRGIQLAKLPKTQTLQLQRSKSMPSLPQLSRNRNKTTDLPPDFPELRLHRSTSPSSHHPSSRLPIRSETSNAKLLPKSSERRLHHSVSDNLIRYSLDRHPIPIVRDPNNDAGLPPGPNYKFVSSDCLPSATRQKVQADIYPHSKHRPGGSKQDKGSEVTRGRAMLLNGSPLGMGQGDAANEFSHASSVTRKV